MAILTASIGGEAASFLCQKPIVRHRKKRRPSRYLRRMLQRPGLRGDADDSLALALMESRPFSIYPEHLSFGLLRFISCNGTFIFRLPYMVHGGFRLNRSGDRSRDVYIVRYCVSNKGSGSTRDLYLVDLHLRTVGRLPKCWRHLMTG